jgi:ParB-like chromosome segregation protein Spo0J
LLVNIELVTAEHAAHYPKFVCELAELIKRGFIFAPIACVRREGKYIIQDGHHRYEAHVLAGCKQIEIQ